MKAPTGRFVTIIETICPPIVRAYRYIPYRNFRLQWNTNWCPGYRTELVTASNSWPSHNRERFTHTVDFSWNFQRNMDFFLNGRNVFNQDGGTYRLRSDLRARWVETGAIWSTGVRTTF